ncbi:hypothetical protein Ahy_B10g101414 [Arachis hypogaea]|uniref:CCHC-type domain-containing protein n=1 Tax=Arachis hypogaea TaxID=3818 RepID=A0A444WZK3_ARAHY|nr:hypothetical protein Ahy_B10g101414 [Arachis hypogaea]
MPQPTAISKPWSKGKETKKVKTKRGCKNIKIAAAACGRRPLTRAAATGNIARTTGKGKQPKTAFVALSSSEGSSDSHDSDDSAEDEAYRPGGDEVSSEEDLSPDRSAEKSNVKLRSRPGKKLTKGKKSVMVEEDGPVCADSDSEDNPYNDYDSGDSWHSEEMKTPPNSEDELEEVDSDDVFPAFREGGRFGELRLEVGMTFTTKMEFKEVVREYCIQEGRRIWFKKNDNVRMKAVCKDASCGWLVYASNNTENNCWQIKTFMDDHNCVRETKNRLANRKWLACKLVKKLRKYPNLRHSEVVQYFKTKWMPCVHACAALARAGKRPEDYCHQWLTMEAYNNTYAFHINPIPGQALWKKSPYNRPQAPKFRNNPRPLKKKRRKDADEEPSGSKKLKTKMKRIYKKGRCRCCGEAAHTRRNCPKRAAAEEAAAAAEAAAAEAATAQPTAANGGEGQANSTAPVPEAPTEINLDQSQPPLEATDDSQQLPLKRKLAKGCEKPTSRSSNPPVTTPPAATPPRSSHTSRNPPPNPMQGATQGTATRLANFMKFVPNPGFKAPRHKK